MTKLKQLIDRLKRTPMNVGTLKKMLPSYATFKTLDQLSDNKKSVFKNHDCVVLLIESKFSPIGHFVVLLKSQKGYIEYFSSFGGRVETELKLLGQNGDKIKRLLGKNYSYNSLELQSQSSSIQDCALFVLARIILRKLKLREFQQLFKSNITLRTSDDIVSMLCVLLLVDL
jgi:hypothetical protein